MNVTVESLRKQHGDKAEKVFREIADKGGFGEVGTAEGNVNPAYEGGLDVSGILADSNKAIPSATKDRIAELAGVDREKATAMVDQGETTSSASKMQKATKEK